MDSFKATASTVLDKRRSKEGNVYPVKIRVYFDDDDRSYKTGIDLAEKEWEKMNGKNLRDDDLRTVKRKVNKFLEKANKIIDSLEEFTFEAFKEAYYEERKIRKLSSLKDLFDMYVEELNKNDQVGTAISYGTTLNSIEKFRKNMKVSDVNKDFLNQYERWLMSKDLSPSTAGIYLRQLRRIMNVAIDKGLLSRDKYPFKGFTIPTSRNIKKALKESEVKALLDFRTDNEGWRKGLDFWLFSYLSNGMNMTDICHLKPDCLEGTFFHFIREKTKRTRKKNLKPIKVPLSERSIQIIERWRNRDEGNPYLFPVLDPGMTAIQIKYRIQDFIYFVNKQMKEIAKELKFDVKVGTYVARHSHSTILKRKGAPTQLIKENLGHSSELITEYYLDDFNDDAKMKYSKLLTDL